MRTRSLSRIACLSVVFTLCCSLFAFAQVPPLINYQGYLEDNGNPVTGTLPMIFSLYDAETGGTPLWTETQSSVTITDGVFNVLLGSVTTLNLDFSADYWLETSVNSEILSPRQRLVSVGYAFRAEYANTATETDPQFAAWDKSTGISITESQISDLTHDNLGNHTATQNLDLSTYLLVGNGGSTGITIDNAGHVGIGTATPGGRLGLADANTTLDVDGSGNLTFTDAVTGAKTLAELADNLGAAASVTAIVGEIWTAKGSNKFWYAVAMSADGTIQTAVPDLGQIYVSTDAGETWTAKESNRSWRDVAMSADGTIQTAVEYNGQIYVSTDSGNTWTATATSEHWYGIAMSADGTIQTAVADFGQIYVSTDAGETWTAKESNRSWRDVAMSADGTIQTAVEYNGQIYVSTDSGETWSPKASNRYWEDVAMSADGTIQTAVGSGEQIYVSADAGNTWTAKESVRNSYAVAMSADGTIQTAGVANGQIYVSTDAGNTWTAYESNRLWNGIAMSADGTVQTAVAYNGHIYVADATLKAVSFSGDVSVSMDLAVDGAMSVGTDVQVTGYVQLGTVTGTPPSADCDEESEAGKMTFDPSADILYVCSGTSGWVTK